MGCAKPVVGLTVPAGYSFNLDGTTIYLSMACVFLTQAYNVHLSLDEVMLLIGVLLLTSKGAAGVTGSGFIVLASTLQALNVIPVEGLALLIGVDRFMSEARALTNIIGNGVATVWLANHEKAFDRAQPWNALRRSESVNLKCRRIWTFCFFSSRPHSSSHCFRGGSINSPLPANGIHGIIITGRCCKDNRN